MDLISAAPPDDSSGANPSSVKSDDGSPLPDGRVSPVNCAICLGTCRNKSFTDSCLHQFCFKCLLTWSKVKAECPLCKQNFRSIIHNVRSNHQYEEYLVEQRVEEVADRIDMDTLTSTTRRFRYRTTLTLPRRESLAIQQLLLHYPLVAGALPPRVPPPHRRRRCPAAFRRTVYRHNLWARPLPDFTGRFRDCRPEFYRYNDTQMHRLVPWLNRELHYLLNENIGHISYVLTRILELLPQYHINSPEFREAMQRYFGDRTEHFLHELYCFASTPYDISGYDRNVQYTTDTRISAMVNEISSSDSEASVDSDIVMVSSSHPAAPQPAPGPSTGPAPAPAPAPVYPHNYIPHPHPPQDNVIPIETISHSDTEDDDEVMVVGFIKAPRDRTPEVVDLVASDSDVIVQDNDPPPPPPAHSASLVKLSLRRQATRRGSDSSDSYHPPSRRRRRDRSQGCASTRDTTPSTCVTPSPQLTPSASAPTTASPSPMTPSPPVTPSPSSTTWSSSTDSTIDTFTDTDTFSSSGSYRRGVRKRKTKKTYRKRKSKKLSSSRSRRRDRKDSSERVKPETSTNSRYKKKSTSGIGVKSSKRISEQATVVREASDREGTPPLPTSVAADQPGPSGLAVQSCTAGPPDRAGRDHKRHQNGRESRRLKSVVKVMYNRTSEESSPSCHPIDLSVFQASGSSESTSCLDSSFSIHSTKAVPVDSDSEDDMPLNLTIQK